MARPRKTTGSNKTSFGKRSEAEKSFRDKKKRSGRGDDPRGGFSRGGDSESRPRTSRFGEAGKPSFGKRDGDSSERPRSSYSPGGDSDRPRSSRFGGTKPSFGRRDDNSNERPKRYSKPFEKREGGGDGPFRKRSSDSFQSRTDGPSRFGKKPFQKRDDGTGSERPYKKRESGPFESRSDRPSGFGKRPFTKREGSGDEKPPFRKSSSFGSRPGSAPRFEKKSFDRKDEGSERPFKNRDSSSFDSRGSRPERPAGFTKKPVTKREEGGDEKPFKKTITHSFDSNAGDKPRFEKKSFQKRDAEGGEKKPFERKEGEDKPFRKTSEFGLPYKRKPYDKERGEKPAGRAKPEPKQKSDPDMIRLNRFMANSGVGSRREADELIKMGLVTVNGETVTEMGHKVKMTDDVRYEGKKLKAEKPVYILLNKPKGFITTTADPQDRNTVMNLVAGAGKERIYPVGRLDRNTTGLLLLTNDGELADKLTHPSYNVKKIYRVELDKPLTKNDFIKIKEGVHLEEGRAMVDDIAIVGDDNSIVGLEIHIGWNRVVRRIFESLGYEVLRLDRVAYAGLDKKDIARGQWRFLKPEEIVMLKHFK